MIKLVHPIPSQALPMPRSHKAPQPARAAKAQRHYHRNNNKVNSDKHHHSRATHNEKIAPPLRNQRRASVNDHFCPSCASWATTPYLVVLREVLHLRGVVPCSLRLLHRRHASYDPKTTTSEKNFKVKSTSRSKKTHPAPHARLPGVSTSGLLPPCNAGQYMDEINPLKCRDRTRGSLLTPPEREKTVVQKNETIAFTRRGTETQRGAQLTSTSFSYFLMHAHAWFRSSP